MTAPAGSMELGSVSKPIPEREANQLAVRALAKVIARGDRRSENGVTLALWLYARNRHLVAA